MRGTEWWCDGVWGGGTSSCAILIMTLGLGGLYGYRVATGLGTEGLAQHSQPLRLAHALARPRLTHTLTYPYILLVLLHSGLSRNDIVLTEYSNLCY